MKKIMNRVIFVLAAVVMRKLIKMLSGSSGNNRNNTWMKKVNKNYLKLRKYKPGKENLKEVVKI